MNVLAISDMHGALLPAERFDCDLLLIGGDVCPMNNEAAGYQREWLEGRFTEWLLSLPARTIVGIGGNHDFALQDDALGESLPWTYLADAETTVNGLRIWGTPWVPNLPTWAFHSGMGSRVRPEIVEAIPEGIDVLLSHGPVNGYGDKVRGGGNVGCLTMREHIRKIKPRAFVCGHIHEGRGWYRSPWVSQGIYNVSQLDERYTYAGGPVEVQL